MTAIVGLWLSTAHPSARIWPNGPLAPPPPPPSSRKGLRVSNTLEGSQPYPYLYPHPPPPRRPQASDVASPKRAPPPAAPAPRSRKSPAVAECLGPQGLEELKEDARVIKALEAWWCSIPKDQGGGVTLAAYRWMYSKLYFFMEADAQKAVCIKRLRRDWAHDRYVSCRVVSCRVVSCRVVSCRVVSCRVMLCCVVLCCVVLCCVVLCCVVLCCVVLCCVVLCCVVLCCVVLCCVVLCALCSVPCAGCVMCAVCSLLCAVRYGAVLCTVLCYTVLCAAQ